MQVRLLKIFDPILVGLPGKKTASDICLTLTFKLFRTRVLVYHYALKGYPSYNAVLGKIASFFEHFIATMYLHLLH